MVKGGSTDTDKDGLTDSEEVDWNCIDVIMNGKEYTSEDGIVIALPTLGEILDSNLFPDIESFKRLKMSTNYYNRKIRDINILPIKSDPTMGDGDNDGILDTIEIFPLKYDETPIEFCKMYHKDLISKKDIKFTNDGFFMCYKPLEDILIKLNYDEKYDDINCRYYFDDWYIYAVKDKKDYKYSLLKIREPNDYDIINNDKKYLPSVSIPFIELSMNNIFGEYDSLSGTDIFNDLNNICIGNGDYDYIITSYFAESESSAGYLIGNLYIDKTLKESFVSDDKITVNYSSSVSEKIFDIITRYGIGLLSDYISTPKYIKINDKSNISLKEEKKLLKYTLGNESLNALLLRFKYMQ